MKLKDKIKSRVVKEVKEIVAEEVDSGIDILKSFILPNTLRAICIVAVVKALCAEKNINNSANITLVILKGGNLL